MEASPQPQSDLDTVGVRELRQNLSVYLRRIADGETLVVTDRGQPVAHLTPLPRLRVSTLDQLVAEGRMSPPMYRSVDGVRPLPLPDTPGTMTATEALNEQRREPEWMNP